MGDRLETLIEKLSLHCDKAKITVSPVVTNTSKLLVPINPERKGLIIYNNSSNSGYIAFGSPANSANNMSVIIASFQQFVMPFPIFTGEIYGIRNAGTGTFLITEFYLHDR